MKQWNQSTYKNFVRKRKKSNNEVHKNNPSGFFLGTLYWKKISLTSLSLYGSMPFMQMLRAQITVCCWGRVDKAGADKWGRGQSDRDGLPCCRRTVSGVPILEMLRPHHRPHSLWGVEAVGQPRVLLWLYVCKRRLVSWDIQLPVVITHQLNRMKTWVTLCQR